MSPRVPVSGHARPKHQSIGSVGCNSNRKTFDMLSGQSCEVVYLCRNIVDEGQPRVEKDVLGRARLGMTPLWRGARPGTVRLSLVHPEGPRLEDHNSRYPVPPNSPPCWCKTFWPRGDF